MINRLLDYIAGLAQRTGEMTARQMWGATAYAGLVGVAVASLLMLVVVISTR